MVEEVPLPCIREVSGWDLDRDSNHPDRDHSLFSPLLHANFGVLPPIRTCPLSFATFSLNYLLIILPPVAAV
jgi:hypothetical protein